MNQNENFSPAVQAALRAVASSGPDDCVGPFHRNAILHNVRITTQPDNDRRYYVLCGIAMMVTSTVMVIAIIGWLL